MNCAGNTLPADSLESIRPSGAGRSFQVRWRRRRRSRRHDTGLKVLGVCVSLRACGSESCWVKAGLEYVDGVCRLSTVGTWNTHSPYTHIHHTHTHTHSPYTHITHTSHRFTIHTPHIHTHIHTHITHIHTHTHTSIHTHIHHTHIHTHPSKHTLPSLLVSPWLTGMPISTHLVVCA